MKYPYIGQFESCVVLFTSARTGLSIDSPEIYRYLIDQWHEEKFKNITREYLSNTWGVVESKEHAEFIVELAELHGLELLKDGLSNKNYFNIGEKSFALFINKPTFIGGCKQITIPLPPKSVKSEWPQVGDEVEVRHDSGQVLKGELLAITSEYAIIQQLGHEQHLYLSAWKFSKPKTPEEELRDGETVCGKPKTDFEKAIDKVKEFESEPPLDVSGFNTIEESRNKRNKSKQAYEILKSLDYDYDLVKQKWFKKHYI